MKNMKNENIVAYYASFVDATELCIVMDLCQRGEITRYCAYCGHNKYLHPGQLPLLYMHSFLYFPKWRKVEFDHSI